MPRRFHPGNVSFVERAHGCGFAEHRNRVTIPVFSDYLRRRPECVADWLSWSSDKRTAGWSLARRGHEFLAGFVPVTGEQGPEAGVKAVTPEQQVIIMSESGKVIRANASEIRETGRAAQGVRVLQVDEGDRIAGIVVLPERDETETEEPEPAPDNVTPTEGQRVGEASMPPCVDRQALARFRLRLPDRRRAHAGATRASQHRLAEIAVMRGEERDHGYQR